MNAVEPDSTHRTPTPQRDEFWVYAGALAAGGIPASFLVLANSVYGLIVAERLQDWGIGKRSTALALVVLAILEARWLRDLFGLIMARGRVEILHAMRTAPAGIASRRRRRLAFAAASFGAILALGAAEIVFRFLDLRPPPRPRAASADHLAVNNAVNVLGIREDWSSIADEDPRFRILFLGDSMVYGDGVERDECFCRLVAPLLAADFPQGVLTINAGFPGTDPARQLEHYQQLRIALRPQVIVHVVYPNDLGIEMHRQLDHIYRIRDEDVWVGDWCFVLRFAERQVRYWIAWKQTLDYFRGGFDSASRDAAWQRLERSIEATAEVAHADGAAYAVVLFPWLVRLDDYPLGDVHVRMEGVARRLGVPYLDLLPTFSGRDAERLRVSLANEHPNLDGHRLAAARIAEFLRAEVLPSVRH